ncbi:MAG: S41 family peptidase [Bacteroidales bacterium]|nr:S41 family peptidase [Bacteroidales bacterium]
MKIFKSSGNWLLVFLLTVFISNQGFTQSNDTREAVRKYASAMQIINYAYVDSVHNDKLVEEAIVEMLQELDPHSVYIPPEEVKRTNEPLEGNFEGVGIRFQIHDDTILVVSAIPGGPSDKLGIMAGDKIVKIDGENATGDNIDNQYVIDHLRGKKGSKVTVSIFRKSRKGLIDFTITRDEIPINSVDATFMLTDKTGFIKLNRFSRTTMDEVNESLKTLKKEGMKNLILDLRNNSGGYLNVAVDLADEFLDDNKLIVYTEGMRSPKKEFHSTRKGGFEEGKLIVIINEGSASASEIVSGAVQDWDRGLVLGRRSFGKGLVQRPFRLPDSAMIRLTTARYHTPTGRCIQKPYENGVEDYYKDFKKRFEEGELVNADSIDFPDSLKYFTKINDRVVYGGGGIMPDVFIPLDTTHVSDYYTDIRRKGLMNEFILEYLEKNRNKLERNYKNTGEFVAGFEVKDKMMKDFIDFATERDVEYVEEEFKRSEKFMTHVLKGLIANNLFDISAYYQVIHGVDDELQRAIEIIKNGTMFEKLASKGE